MFSSGRSSSWRQRGGTRRRGEVATDHEEYRDFAIEQAADSGLYAVTRPQPPEAVFETKYALKWRDLGKPLYYVVFKRNGSLAQPVPHLERPQEMPHALLTGALPPTSALSKTVLRYGGGHVVLHEAAVVMPTGSAAPLTATLSTTGHPDPLDIKPRWLVRATIEETDLKQQLLIMVQQRQPDEVIVRPRRSGDRVITRPRAALSTPSPSGSSLY